MFVGMSKKVWGLWVSFYKFKSRKQKTAPGYPISHYYNFNENSQEVF